MGLENVRGCLVKRNMIFVFYLLFWDLSVGGSIEGSRLVRMLLK